MLAPPREEGRATQRASRACWAPAGRNCDIAWLQVPLSSCISAECECTLSDVGEAETRAGWTRVGASKAVNLNIRSRRATAAHLHPVRRETPEAARCAAVR